MRGKRPGMNRIVFQLIIQNFTKFSVIKKGYNKKIFKRGILILKIKD